MSSAGCSLTQSTSPASASQVLGQLDKYTQKVETLPHLYTKITSTQVINGKKKKTWKYTLYRDILKDYVIQKKIYRKLCIHGRKDLQIISSKTYIHNIYKIL